MNPFSFSGIGATTLYTIGAPYLDDSIKSKNSPFYFGMEFALN